MGRRTGSSAPACRRDGLRRAGRPLVQARQQEVAVAAQAAGVDLPRDQVEDAVVQGHVRDPHDRGGAAGVEHLAEVAEQAEAAHVGAGVHADLRHGRGRAALSAAASSMAGIMSSSLMRPFLSALASTPMPRRLVSTSRSPGRAPAL